MSFPEYITDYDLGRYDAGDMSLRLNDKEFVIPDGWAYRIGKTLLEQSDRDVLISEVDDATEDVQVDVAESDDEDIAEELAELEDETPVPGVDLCVHCGKSIEDGWCPTCDGDSSEPSNHYRISECSYDEGDVFGLSPEGGYDDVRADTVYRVHVSGAQHYGVFVTLQPGVHEDVTGLVHKTRLPLARSPGEYETGDAVYVELCQRKENGDLEFNMVADEVDNE